MSAVLDAPGKFVLLNIAVVPVAIGSPAAIPRPSRGITEVDTDWLNKFTESKLPPKLSWCEPLIQFRVSENSFTGEFRRDEFVVVVTLEIQGVVVEVVFPRNGW